MCGISIIAYRPGYRPTNVKDWTGYSSLDQRRGPDQQKTEVIELENGVTVEIHFARLAIRGLDEKGLQPFSDEDSWVVCNGEIYNYSELATEFNLDPNGSDCTAILPAIKKYGLLNTLTKVLDAEYALAHLQNTTLTIARDRYGVRPLYFGYSPGALMIGSELKTIQSSSSVFQVPPQLIIRFDLLSENFEAECHQQIDYFTKPETYLTDRSLLMNLYRQSLTSAVQKRLVSDRPLGFFLSGGLDSTLVVAIATRLMPLDKIVCFTIGLEGSADVAAAREAAKFLGISNHHILTYTIEEGIAILPLVIREIETFDVTTIRASVPQYLLSQFIKEKTDIRVLLSGEGSDEIHGSYRYFRNAPDSESFWLESRRLLSELHFFDNKRTDRTTASHGLEVRVPYLDHEYVILVAETDPVLLMYKKEQMEKQLLRDSFKGYLPDSLLYRSKEAFSDAVSGEVSWAGSLRNLAEEHVSDQDFDLYQNASIRPLTKEAVYYRRIFDEYYPGRGEIIPHYWMPKFQGDDANITDPSATVLACY
jgi:asparagine synthase (glutamine-hydrolysing)